MKEIILDPSADLQPYVNSIMITEVEDINAHTNIPLFADGYPGIMFQEAEKGFYMLPRNKKLSPLFLYGQTLHPVSLDVKGPFKFIVFQLYPFASKYLLDVDPKTLNDECYDLMLLQHLDIRSIAQQLEDCNYTEGRMAIMSKLILQLIERNKIPSDDRIQQAISLIISHKGQATIKEVRDQLYISERTFERQFIAQVGLAPKQFARIIQFQCSLKQLTDETFEQLVDVGLDSGFADQSHFIRAFKKYTGKTPSEFLSQVASQ